LGGRRTALAAAVLTVLLISCDRPSSDSAAEKETAATQVASESRERETTDARCAFPTEPETLRTDGSAVLLAWDFPDDAVYSQTVLPVDSAYRAYRTAIRADGADLKHPVSDQPTPQTDDEAELWRNEDINRDLAQTGEAGIIEQITCLDALLFAYQNSRVPQLTQPTEFLASVLRKEVAGQPRLVVVFGAGDEMFPPKTVYGFDVVDEYVAAGWRYSYALHNHTIQQNGERLALGTPALSSSDVQLMRNLVEGTGLESARVTNGFFTYSVSARELDRLRSR
jgi:hypothetical protein